MRQGSTLLPPPTQGTPAPAPAAPATVCGIPLVASPSATYNATIAQRNELSNQRVSLVNTRDGWADRARRSASGADEIGVQSYLKAIDARIADVTGQLAEANTRVACMAGVPGAIPPRNSGPPENELAIAGVVLSSMLALPLVIAWSRRLWRRSAQVTPQIPRELNERLMRIEQTVESVAIEVERVGEGQRFVTNLFAQNGAPRAVGAGAMEPVDVQQRERLAQERGDR